MPENEILAEIHRTREVIASECDYDVAKLFAHFRNVTAKLEAEGWRVAAPEADVPSSEPEVADVSSVVREEPPSAR
jgi:hypothetical protein